VSVGVTTSHKLQPAAMLCHEHDSDENFPEKFKSEIFWKNIAENFLKNFPYGKIFYGKLSTSHH
jgi:hypothetical protein